MSALEAAKRPALDYPVLLRMGRQNARTISVPFGPLDVAIASNGTVYVLCRRNETRPQARTSFWVVPPGEREEDEWELVPILEGRSLGSSIEDTRLPGPSMCALTRDGVLLSTDEFANVVVATRADDGTCTVWGASGRAPGQLDAPCGIALDADETVWVASSRSHRIQRFTRDGRFLGGFGDHGSGSGQLDHPWGIAWDRYDGSVLVADWRNDRIQRFRPDGTLVSVMGPSLTGLERPLHRPSGVTVDRHGDIYVTDRGNDRVLLLNNRGLFIESFHGDAIASPRRIARLMDDKDMLRRRDGVVAIERERRFMAPVSARAGGDDTIYVTDTGRHRVQTYRMIQRPLDPSEVAPAADWQEPTVYK